MVLAGAQSVGTSPAGAPAKNGSLTNMFARTASGNGVTVTVAVRRTFGRRQTARTGCRIHRRPHGFTTLLMETAFLWRLATKALLSRRLTAFPGLSGILTRTNASVE